MSDQQAPHRLRGMRNTWELTQPELMKLIGGKSGSSLSLIERAEKIPNAQAVIASTIIFGHSIEHLFKSLYDAAEDHILREAYLLEQKLIDDPRPRAARKRVLLSLLIQRIMDRHSRK